MTITSFAQLTKLIEQFDFSTLDFHPHSNCIFWNADASTFEAWIPSTSIETAEQQNNVLYVGKLSLEEATRGKKPYPNEERIKMHYTRELV